MGLLWNSKLFGLWKGGFMPSMKSSRDILARSMWFTPVNFGLLKYYYYTYYYHYYNYYNNFVFI